MSTAMSIPDYFPNVGEADIEQALTIGDLAKMPPAVRVRYYLAACDSAGLNPLTQPFTPMKNQAGQVVLYANATAAEQLRKKHGVSIKVLSRETIDGLYTVTVAATTADGRCDESQGILDVAGLKGQGLANARMKTETKAKRRATLALCGLGYSLADDMTGPAVRFDPQTGEIPAAPAVRLVNHGADQTDLYGEGMQPTAPESLPRPVLPEALAAAKAQCMAEIEERRQRNGHGPSVRYWLNRCEYYAVGRPDQLTLDQLQELLRLVQTESAEAAEDTDRPF